MWLFRWWIFYPLAALLAAGFIVASMGPGLIDHEARPVFGRIDQNALVLDGESLGHPQASAGASLFIARNARWSPIGLRVAVLPGQGAASGASAGVRVLLAPERGRALAGTPLRVQVAIRPVAATTAPRLAIGVDRGGSVEWVTLPTSQLEGVLTYTFPAAASGPVAIAIRPESDRDDYAYGLEVAAIRITSGA